AIGDRDKSRAQWLQPLDRGPKGRLRLVIFGRGEFERYENRIGFPVAAVLDHVLQAHAASLIFVCALAVASHTLTMSFSDAPLEGAMVVTAPGARPAAANQPATSLSEKPKRRWA